MKFWLKLFTPKRYLDVWKSECSFKNDYDKRLGLWKLILMPTNLNEVLIRTICTKFLGFWWFLSKFPEMWNNSSNSAQVYTTNQMWATQKATLHWPHLPSSSGKWSLPRHWKNGRLYKFLTILLICYSSLAIPF